MFYWVKTANFYELENKNIFGITKGAIVLDSINVQDIDNISDWQIAEFKFNYLNNIKNGYKRKI